ncbi:pyridoxamine 5'-phosphate oxidase [Pseudonocardia alni]|uniref:pyridoxamine 5'-phosphate oxidase n=1 Tax=Pseudonocardia alni TaxID=33907 RepID=UPI001AD65061|nr:pyridoxamine 5'-phosphate oxidase [Pseudonocardia alni]MBO4240152.1 pyridoxamine 5'-phosphate oxidase [Pseudonocardia alni]
MTDAPALARMRTDYSSRPLDVDDLAPTWHEQLTAWLEQAREAGLTEPNAMVLATSDPDGVPSSRTVLCKGLDAGGIVFYTNYTSAKSHDLNRTRVASVTFPWYDLQRQVQLSGRVERCSDAQSDAYWALRPRGSQLGAWASAQSTIVAGRTVLDQALAGVTRRFDGVEEIPRPPHWGGWRIVPWQVEFWQGRADRMHDRLRFEVGRDDSWSVRRLAP